MYENRDAWLKCLTGPCNGLPEDERAHEESQNWKPVYTKSSTVVHVVYHFLTK